MRCCEEPELNLEGQLVVCVNCGLVRGCYLSLTRACSSYQQRYQTVMTPTYSRGKRFKAMMNQVVTARFSESDVPVLEKLSGQTFENVDKLLVFLKTLKCRDKRYNSLHLFAKLHCADYSPQSIPADWLNLLTRQTRLFNRFESAFQNNFPKQPFLSYSWLVRRFLRLYNLEQFTRFVKVLKCRRRRKRYERLFTTCLEIITRQNTPLEFWGVSEACVLSNDELADGHYKRLSPRSVPRDGTRDFPLPPRHIQRGFGSLICKPAMVRPYSTMDTLDDGALARLVRRLPAHQPPAQSPVASLEQPRHP